MQQPGITRLFILVCIAVLFASYGVGLGVRKIRLAGAAKEYMTAVDIEKPADDSESDADEVKADTEVASEPPQKWAEGAYEQPEEEFAARPQRSNGRGAEMVLIGSQGSMAMGERFQKMAVEETARRQLQARRARQDEENLRRVQEMWPDLDEQTRAKIQGIIDKWPTMSEEERDYYRAGNID